jgi:hypothetical protein
LKAENSAIDSQIVSYNEQKMKALEMQSVIAQREDL